MKYSNILRTIFGPVMAIMMLVDFIAWAKGADATFAVIAAGAVTVIFATAAMIDSIRDAWIARCVRRYSAFRQY